MSNQPLAPGVIYVCPERDIECGRNPAAWCAACPQRPKAHVADERAAFEAEMRKLYGEEHFALYLEPFEGQIYRSTSMNAAWNGWQAARAAIPAGANVATALQFWNHAASPTDDILGYRSHMQEIVGPAGYVKWEDVKGRLGAGAPAETLTASQIAAGTAVLGDDGKPIGRNTAIVVADAMRCRPAETPKPVAKLLTAHEMGGIQRKLIDAGTYDYVTYGAAVERAVLVRAGAFRDAAQPAPTPATDARDGERYRKLKTLSKPQLLIWRGAFGCSDEAIDKLLDLLSANSPREAG